MGGKGKREVVRLGEDGLPTDDVPHTLATPDQVRRYEAAADRLYRFQAPTLLDRNDPHSYLVVGLLDGTGNDANQDPLHATNVAKLQDQVFEINNSGLERIQVEYSPGPGTQKNPVAKKFDGATGHTSLERAEEMYAKLLRNAQRIFDADPHARLSIYLEGFSRGASEVPLLARMVHERGIPVGKSLVEGVDEFGNPIRTYTEYHQAPGATPMAVGLYDPVPTGYMELLDRRLPPSVVSGFQINAADERRGLFPVDRILPDGLSEDGRFLSVTVTGVHSDIGGSYLRGGLGDRSLNLMTDYRNALSTEPLFQRLHETQDPRMNVIHHSTEGDVVFKYSPRAGRDTPQGEVTQLVPDYSHWAAPGEVVTLVEQSPEPVDESLLRSVSRGHTVVRSPQAPEPAMPAGEAMLARVMDSPNVELRAYQPPMPLPVKVTFGVAAAGGVLSVMEANAAGDHAAAQLTLDNPEAAKSVLAHYGARGMGGWAGGAAAGAAMGWETGPGAMVFIATGALAGSSVGDHVAKLIDNHAIYHQSDAAGVPWAFNGRAWERQGLVDATFDAADNPARTAVVASYEKARELNYRATNTATALALGEAEPPVNPFRLPADEQDRGSLKPAPWTFDADGGQWHRRVVVGADRNDLDIIEVETASPERAASLSRASLEVMQANVVNGPAGIAARYEAAYAQYGWQKFGPMPEAVKTALTDHDRLIASDGKLYERQPDGDWIHRTALPGNDHAEGTLRLELNTSRALRQANLQQHAEEISTAIPRGPKTAEATQHEELMYRYRVAGTELQPEWREAIDLAMQRTRAEHALSGAGSVQLKPGPDGRIGADSPIVHLQRDWEGVDRIAAVTSSEDIRQALAEVRARHHDASPVPQAPDQRIERATEQERDAHAQAQREANRQGVAQPEPATLETIRVTGQRREDAVDGEPEKAVPPPAEFVAAPPRAPDTMAVLSPEPEPRTPAVPAETPIDALARQPADVHAPPAASAPKAPAPGPDDALRPGSRGDQIELLQFRLDRQGYRGPQGEPLPQNGHYGPETEHAVRQFQTAHGLPATGIADLDTQSAVARAPSPQRAPVEHAVAVVTPSPEPTRDAFERTVPPPTHEVAATQRDMRSDDVVPLFSPAAPRFASGGSKSERDDERETVEREREPRTGSGMTAPGHPAHALYLQSQHAMEKAGAAPGMAGLNEREREALGAAAVAQALSTPGWNFTGVDHVVPGNKIDPQTGRLETVFVVQGALDDPGHRRIAVNVEQALSQSVEQSSSVAQAAMQTRQQSQEQDMARMQAQGIDEGQGPVMRMGAR